MGKNRTKIIGLEEVEKQQKEETKKRIETKKALRQAQGKLNSQ